LDSGQRQKPTGAGGTEHAVNCALPDSSPAAPLVAALMSVLKVLQEHPQLLPAETAQGLHDMLAELVRLLVIEEVCSAGRAEDAIDAAAGKDRC
jgi:hypothetical protein